MASACMNFINWEDGKFTAKCIKAELPCGQFCRRSVGVPGEWVGRHGPGVLGGQEETSELISKGPIGLSQVNTERHHVGERTRS